MIGCWLVVFLGLVAWMAWDEGMKGPTTADSPAASLSPAEPAAAQSVPSPQASQEPPLGHLHAAPGKTWLSILEVLPEPVIWQRIQEATPQAVPRAQRQVIRSSVLNQPELAAIRQLQVGDTLGLPSGPDSWLPGEVGMVRKEGNDLMLGGLIAGRADHAFSLRFADKGQVYGTIVVPSESRAWVIEPHVDGRLLLQEKPLGAVICAGMPLADPHQSLEVSAAQSAIGFSAAAMSLDSLPSAVAVFYLDFDGALVQDPSWYGGVPVIASPAQMGDRLINNAEIQEVWEMVAEDFRPFQVSVTTNEKRYLDAPIGFRMRCIVTPTRTTAPSYGGVAFLNSFSRAGTTFSDDIPCWSFNSSTPQIMAVTISHELGHTVGLMHDGRNLGYNETYYYGHGSGSLSWGPLMGAPFNRKVSQWSKGEYLQANLFEDDVAVIANSENAFGFRADTVGNTIEEAKLMDGNFTGKVKEKGLILSEQDQDVYRFINQQGAILFSAKPNAVDPNLKVKLELLNAAGEVLFVANPNDALTATVNRVTAAGEHYLRVSGGETGTPLTSPISGFTRYGSIGGYELTGSFTPLPMNPYLVEQPQDQTVEEGQRVVLQVRALSHSQLRYQWFHSVNGVERAIPNATNPTWRVASASEATIGDYHVRIRNAHGTELSQSATVQVLLKPRVKQQVTRVEIAAGEGTTLSPTFVGEPPLQFQWFKNNQPIAEATEATLTLPSTTWEDAGNYQLRITNTLGQTLSKPTRVVIHSPPVFLSAIPTLAVPIGGNAVLTHQIAGSPGLSYQWSRDGVLLPGQNRSTLKLAGSSGSEGSYSLRVTNPFGETLSEPTQVTLFERLRISKQPDPQTVLRGQQVEMTVEALGSSPISYQWQWNGIDLPGATQSVLVLDAASWTQRGQYRVLVSNPVSRLLSRVATLEVISRPEILVQPVSHRGPAGGSTRFQVRAGGSGKLFYQWFKNNAPLARATSATLVLRRLGAQDEGDYSVRVSNTHGEILSETATLSVVASPSITLHPQPSFFPVGGQITALVTATGAETLHYQWQRNKRDLPGQTDTQLTLPAQSHKDSGSYRCIVWNDVGRVVSRAAKIQVQTAPQITVQPVPATLYEGGKATFSVRATGSKTLKYQWRRNGQPVGQKRVLNLKDIRFGTDGTYDVVVSNRVGSAVSVPVQLTLIPVPAPSVNLLVPTRALPSGKFSLVGNHLQFVRSLHVGNRRLGYVILASGELLATAPSDLRTPLAGAAVRVTSLGGEHLVETPLYVGTRAINDDYENSFVITGAYPYTWRDVTDFTHVAQEIGYHTAWWRWIAPRTGLFTLDTRNSNHDTIAAVYSEPSPTTRELVGQNDDFYGMYSRVDFPAIKGVAYRISVGSYSPFASQYGRYYSAISLYPTPAFGSPAQAATELATVNPALHKATDLGAENLVATDSPAPVRLGGPAQEGATPIVFWQPEWPADPSPIAPLTIEFSAALESAPPDSTDEFVWTLYDPQGHALLALVWQAGQRHLSAVNAAGRETALPRVHMEPEGAMQFAVTVDLQKGTWALLVDGEPIVDQAQLEAAAAVTTISHLSVGWLPGMPSTPAAMRFDYLTVSREQP